MFCHVGNLKTRVWTSPYLTMLPICIALFITADDQTVVVTVLPKIMLDMRVSINELDNASWVITGYLLGYLVAMPIAGMLSDSWGRRTIFFLSTGIFILGSVAVTFMPTLSWLIVARIFQSIGAGAMFPISIALAGDIFPVGNRGLAYGLIGASAEAGGVVGPLWGGIVTSIADWRWVFWMNIPLGLIVLVLLVLVLPRNSMSSVKPDYLGAILIALILTTLTLGLARIGSFDFIMFGYIVTAVVGITILVIWNKSKGGYYPKDSLLNSFSLKAVSLAHLLLGGALIIGMVTIPLMANTSMALTPLEGGLWLMRLTVAIPVGAIIGGLLCRWFDYRIPSIIGFLLATIGYVLMSGWDISISDPILTTHLFVTGAGFGLLIAPVMLTATESVDETRMGVAAGIVGAMRILGMTLGIAMIASWGSVRFQGLVSGIQIPITFSGLTSLEIQQQIAELDSRITGAGMQLFGEFFVVAAGLCLLGLLPVLFMKRR